MADITGTSGRDSLTGTAGDDHIQGLDGNDSLNGGVGDDLVEGGEGNDEVRAESGSDVLDGGAGDDILDISNYDSASATIKALGGDGNDLVYVYSSGPHAVSVDAGAGDDEVVVALLQAGSTARLTLGAGADSIRVSPFNLQSGFTPGVLSVTDFQTGAAGDRLDWLDFLGSVLLNWDTSTNPFATGHLRLVQSGADVLLQIDRDAASTGYAFQTLIRFENTDAAALTWQNLDGYPADGSIPSGLVLDGNAGDDRLYGSAGADEINGHEGNNRLWGGAGDDVIRGGSGYDELHGEFGNDRLEGGAGYDSLDGGKGDDRLYGGADADYFHDVDGNDLYEGEGGDDRIDIYRGSLHTDVVTANGGAGNDIFTITSYGAGNTYDLDGGEGDDLFDMPLMKGRANLTLGAGTDTIQLRGNSDALIFSGLIVVADFQTGTGGDVVDVSQFFTGFEGSNPFGDNGLQLVQDGADAVLTCSGRTFMRFTGANVASFVAANFGGYAPDGSPPPGLDIVGTENADTLAGGAGADNIDGLAGNDRIDGGAGGDIIAGGDGDDSIDGGNGNDTIDAGLGNDHVTDVAGDDTIRTGAGDDTVYNSSGSDFIDTGSGNDSILVQRQAGRDGDVVTVNAGDGDDLVSVFLYSRASVTVNVGDGANRVALAGVGGTVDINLSFGPDVIDFGSVFYDYTVPYGRITVSYFVDRSGDRLDLGKTLSAGLTGWDGTTNPFDAGFIRLVQIGEDTRVDIDPDGPAGSKPFFSLVTLKNVPAGTLHADNFAGFTAPVVYGTTGNDVFTVDETSDLIVDPGGVDEVRTTLSNYVLQPGLEKLVYTGAGGADLRGNAGDNFIQGGEGNDFIRLQDGGKDEVYAGAGNDAIYLGAAFSPFDLINGASGKDILALQGNYAGGITLMPEHLIDIETLALLTHGDNRFGGGSASPFSYTITMGHTSVFEGGQLIVNASTLQAGENLTFDARKVTDGSFFIYGGLGTDTLTGGAGVDVFFFGENGRYGAGDHVDGGGGNDILVLRGDYTILMDGASMTNVETVTLMSGSDARFAPAGTPFHYVISTAQNTVAPGVVMTFNGGTLGAAETLAFDGSAETDGGAFRVFGGAANDTLTGGAGNDLIFGGLGADMLRGGAGNDTFRYQGVAESTASAMDKILDFASGDRIDMSRAGHFSFIGSDAFGGHAGELRVQDTGSGNVWLVQADADGDGNADFVVQVTVGDGHALTAGDFAF